MIHARDDYNRIQDPANKIPAEEPVFLLRAQDELAYKVVLYYVHLCAEEGLEEIAGMAANHAKKMKQWSVKKKPDLPVKDVTEETAADTPATAVSQPAGVINAPKKTDRDFITITFTDSNGVACSLQESSVATEEMIWLGRDQPVSEALQSGGRSDAAQMSQSMPMGSRMHLSRKLVAKLLLPLKKFVDTGSL